MLSRNVEDVLGPTALQHLIEGVELFWLRELGNISRVNKEGRRSRHRVDAIVRNVIRHNILVSVGCLLDCLTSVLTDSARLYSRKLQVAPLSTPLTIPPRCPASAINKTVASARAI